MNILKRITAGVLSALTVIGSFPVVEAAPVIEQLNDGRFRFPIMRAEEDNQPSEAEIRPQERYTVWDNGGEQATFLQDGGYRNVWPMHFKMSDGVTARVY